MLYEDQFYESLCVDGLLIDSHLLHYQEYYPRVVDMGRSIQLVLCQI